MKDRRGLASCTDLLLIFAFVCSGALTLCPLVSSSVFLSRLSQSLLMQEEEEKDEGESKDISTPTHWAKLDPKSMKVWNPNIGRRPFSGTLSLLISVFLSPSAGK